MWGVLALGLWALPVILLEFLPFWAPYFFFMRYESIAITMMNAMAAIAIAKRTLIIICIFYLVVCGPFQAHGVRTENYGFCLKSLRF